MLIQRNKNEKSQQRESIIFQLIINLMLQLDEQKVTQQFQKQLETKQKLRTLQNAVFKNYTIKRSISVLHAKTSSPSLSPSKRPSELFIPNSKTQRQQQSFPAVTTICFGNKPKESFYQSQSTRTLSMFTPRVTMQLTQRKTSKQEKLLASIKKLEQSDLKKPFQSKSPLKQARDSQTLLRKNSLFLVSCLKTKYKQRKNVHIGERPEAANHMRLGNFSEKVPINTLYQQRFEYMEEAKQRLLQAKLVRQDQSKLSRLSPLFPEPWETDHR